VCVKQCLQGTEFKFIIKTFIIPETSNCSEFLTVQAYLKTHNHAPFIVLNFYHFARLRKQLTEDTSRSQRKSEWPKAGNCQQLNNNIRLGASICAHRPTCHELILRLDRGSYISTVWTVPIASQVTATTMSVTVNAQTFFHKICVCVWCVHTHSCSSNGKATANLPPPPFVSPVLAHTHTRDLNKNCIFRKRKPDKSSGSRIKSHLCCSHISSLNSDCV
jgi:hypothetical protein